MRIDVLSRHLPEGQGAAAGRILLATTEGLLAEGCEVRVTSWRPEPPTEDLPAWCTWRPLPAEPAWRTRGRALVRPRSDVVRLGWAPAGLPVADDPLSAPALPTGGLATLHYATALDLRALHRRPQPRDLQDLRAERRLRGRSGLLAYSERVAGWAGATCVPVALPVPLQALPLVDEPVAGLLADWTWAPNRAALTALLAAWPDVRAAVPTARLELSGRGSAAVGTLPGVTVLGEVVRSTDALERLAVLAFPCPDTSGPKVKVAEAAAYGVPVLTTRAGAEGLRTSALATAGGDGFAAALAALLRDPAARAERAGRGRADVVAAHAPRPAARARLAALARHEQHEQERRETE